MERDCIWRLLIFILHFYGILHTKISYIEVDEMKDNIECYYVYYYGKLMLGLFNVSLEWHKLHRIK